MSILSRIRQVINPKVVYLVVLIIIIIIINAVLAETGATRLIKNKKNT